VNADEVSSFRKALRAELVLAAPYVNTPLRTVDDLWQVGLELCEPWWHLPLDFHRRRVTLQRLGGAVNVMLGPAVPQLRSALMLQLPSRAVASTWHRWCRSLLMAAVVRETSFTDAFRLAACDAISLARAELAKAPTFTPPGLAETFDSLVLTSAYAHISGQRIGHREVADRARAILMHAILTLERDAFQ
jgi:hypothetical protein